jgi:wyosine [tRNA(Phe)-imidazoG37] synthetase (radical SAM superfamily)
MPERETAFDRPRDFLGNRFVYAVISSRAGGLTLGINMNPGKHCNFDCFYCEVDRRVVSRESKLDVDVMAAELRKTIAFIQIHFKPVDTGGLNFQNPCQSV